MVLSKSKKRTLSLVTALMMLVTSFAVFGFANISYADNGGVDPIQKTFELYYFPKDKSYNKSWWITDSTQWTIKMNTVKNSNPKVAVMRKEKTDNGYQYVFDVKGAGKTVLKFKAKAAGTDKYVNKKVTIKTTKYVCPVKVFKIGKKNYASKFQKRDWYSQKKTISGKVVIKAKKGWKLESIAIWSSNKEKKIKNGAKVTLKNHDNVYATFQKGKKVITCGVAVENW